MTVVARQARRVGRPLKALALLVEVDVRLRLGGFERLAAGAPPRSGGPDPEEGSRVRRRAPAQRVRDAPSVLVLHPCLIEEARRMAQWLRWASRYVPRARCLHRSLALALWFRRRGIAADLCLGIRAGEQDPEHRPKGGRVGRSGGRKAFALRPAQRVPDAPRFVGHAWVECGGLLFEEDPKVYEEYEVLEEVVRGGC